MPLERHSWTTFIAHRISNKQLHHKSLPKKPQSDVHYLCSIPIYDSNWRQGFPYVLIKMGFWAVLGLHTMGNFTSGWITPATNNHIFLSQTR